MFLKIQHCEKNLINKCYNDSLAHYFDIIKTHKLFARKYH